MNARVRSAAALAFLITLGATVGRPADPPEGVKVLDGEWVYVEDRTPDRPVEKHGPNTGPRIKFRVEKDAVVVVRSDGEIRMKLDGTPTDVVRPFGTSQYSGVWKDGAYVYESAPVRDGKRAAKGIIRWTLRPTTDGLVVSVSLDPPTGTESVCLWRHPADIAMPKPAKAGTGDVAWLAGNWVGSRGEKGATTFEERWSPPGGGAMLAVSRTITRDKMVAFEYLRIVERDGGLVYVAQPGGRPATEFVLTELSKSRAVFENPRHDSPQRIVYELSAEGGLTASIGYIKGGTPRRFEFKREGK